MVVRELTGVFGLLTGVLGRFLGLVEGYGFLRCVWRVGSFRKLLVISGGKCKSRREGIGWLVQGIGFC